MSARAGSFVWSGLSVNALYLGAFAHADDIRTASTNATDATDQVKTVELFAGKNGLQLSLEKCGVVINGTKDNLNPNTLAGWEHCEMSGCVVEFQRL